MKALMTSSSSTLPVKAPMKARLTQPIQWFLWVGEKHPTLAWTLSIVWVVAVGGLAVVWKLGDLNLFDETEPLFAEAARQMTLTGDWVTPYFNQDTRFDKPPLVYWLMAIAYYLFGVNEFAVRLPSALSAIALALMGFYTLYQFGGQRSRSQRSRSLRFDQGHVDQQPSAEVLSHPSSHVSSASRGHEQRWWAAWIGSAAIILNLQTIAWGRIGVSDMLLSSCMGTALLSFFCGYAQPHHPQIQARWYLAFYVWSALAVLTKGPVGIVLPGLIIIVFLVYLGNLRDILRELRILQGGLLFLGLTLPWYILVTWANGLAYIESFFGYHNIERFTRVVNRHSAPWYFYFIVILLGFLPWSTYLPVAIARIRVWRRRYWQRQPRDQQLGLFALTWVVVIFSFFTIAVTKLPSYVLPLLPAAGILVALLWSEQMSQPQVSRGVWQSSLVHIGFCLLVGGAVFYSAGWMGNDPTMPDLPDLIQDSGVLIWGGIFWGAIAVFSLVALLYRQDRWLWSISMIGFAAFFVVSLMPAVMIIDSQRQQPLRNLSETIKNVRQPDEEVIMLGFQKPSVVFYTQQPVHYIWNARQAIRHLRETTSANEPASALLLGMPDEIQEAGLRPRQLEFLEEAGVYQLARVTLRPRLQEGL